MFEKEGEKEKVTNRKKERERKTKGSIMIRAKDLQREKRRHVRADQERNVRQ